MQAVVTCWQSEPPGYINNVKHNQIQKKNMLLTQSPQPVDRQPPAAHPSPMECLLGVGVACGHTQHHEHICLCLYLESAAQWESKQVKIARIIRDLWNEAAGYDFDATFES